MKNYIFTLLLIFQTTEAFSSSKENIILSLKNIKNINFEFEQNINGKIEKGNCTIQYPKKIFCKYDLSNKKILVSNGKTLVIKTITSYYLYPLERTPLYYILNKKYLLSKIDDLEGRTIDNKFINFTFFENDNEINVFFDKQTYNLIGWQTLDIYQNLSITYLSSIIKNQNISQNLFQLPEQN